MPDPEKNQPQDHSPHPPVILFDGLCAFCDGSTRLLMRLDRRRRLRFAALQSGAGEMFTSRHGVPDSIDSIVLIHKGAARCHSDAAIGIARLLGFPWSLLAAVWIIPKPFRDWCYRFVARHRYKIFGNRETCRVPEPGQRARVLETAEQALAVMGSAAQA